MGVINRNFLNDTVFADWVRYDFPNSGIYAEGKTTTQMAKELTKYLADCQSVVASATILNVLETDA